MNYDFPALSGDGVADDTAAIQARLDSGMSCVYLPPPEKCYRISAPLKLHSEQELKLDRYTRILLAPNSDCVMLTNADFKNGNTRLAVTGGIWDFDNTRQGPNFMLRHMANPPLPEIPVNTPYNPDLYRGEVMYFENVSNMTVNGVTIRNPGTYAIQFCKLSYFVINDVEFDFTTWNPFKANMDGIHLDGFCHHGKISNVRGTCFDDMVALNANDGRCAAFQGEVSDIDIDGIYCEYCHSAVRLLSTGAELKRITIRNIHGNFYRYAVGLTHFFANRPTRGIFEDIVIADCFCGKAKQPTGESLPWELCPLPLIFCDERIDVGKLTVSNFCREENTDSTPSIIIQKDCRIRNLVIRDCHQHNGLNEPLVFLENNGRTDTMILENIQLEGNQNILSVSGGESTHRQ